MAIGTKSRPWAYDSMFPMQDGPDHFPDGLEIPRVFSDPDVHPFDQPEWSTRPVVVRDGVTGAEVFRDDFEAPESWSETARQIVCTKFAYGRPGTPGRESSARQVIGRVALRIARWGWEQGYFRQRDDAATFCDELTYLLINQYFSFNSPVWFNVGHDLIPGRPTPEADNWRNLPAIGGKAIRNDDIHKHPQVHACFIQGVDDSISGIMDLAKSEALIFKYGSGTGTDLSTLRSTKETLTGGGTPSGPISFMRIYDAVAGTIKSGGKSRRAAKMQTIKCWHPDILDFVRCKSIEEKKARALIAAGYPSDFNGDAYSTVAFQNCNMSVRLTDRFMSTATDPIPDDVIPDRSFPLRAVKTGEIVDVIGADFLLTEIAKGSHFCGDPAVQFEDRFQEWHTTPNAGPINSTNPCGEYSSINESGCNLASHRLTKFEADDGSFDVDRYCAAIDLAIIAQDIVIDPASYPTAKIAENVRRHRQLGLGYADLGALLMSRGFPYDSDEGRHLCSAITSLMTARAYRMSATLAKHRGAFDAYAADADNMMRVLNKHRDVSIGSTNSMGDDSEAMQIMRCAIMEWDAAIGMGEEYGFRNSQASLLAPTGTIGYMMDCDTLGIEPDTALVKHKHLAGGGDMVIVNRAVGRALDQLGYNPIVRDSIVDHVRRYGIVGPEDVPMWSHLAVFDCAIPICKGGRSIAPMGHVRMMSAAQPFISGAISKTCNLPESATVDDIKQIYVDAWKMGLKSITVYRDGSKYSQPLATSAPVAGRNGSLTEGGTPMDSGWTVTDKTNGEARSIPFIDVEEIDVPPDREPIRRRLPDRRKAVVHHFEIAGAHGNFDGYITVGLYDDGRPGEIFMASGKGGSTLDGMLKVVGTMTSMLLQYGIPIEVMARKFSGIGFEPAGPTHSAEIRVAKSIIDYVFKWVALNFSDELKLEWTPSGHAPTIATATTGHVCGECGSANLIIEGRCWRCANCLWVSGGCGG